MGLMTLAAGIGVAIGLGPDAGMVETGWRGLGLRLGFASHAVSTRTVAIDINRTHFNFKITPPATSVVLATGSYNKRVRNHLAMTPHSDIKGNALNVRPKVAQSY